MKIILYAVLAARLGCGNAQGTSGFADSGTIRFEPVGAGFKRPVYVNSPSGDARLFVVEQAGIIRIVKDGVVLPEPFLDIESRVHSDAEQGLLSMAFHPDYPSNGYFFVYFLDRGHNVRVERFRMTANPDVADLSSA